MGSAKTSSMRENGRGEAASVLVNPVKGNLEGMQGKPTEASSLNERMSIKNKTPSTQSSSSQLSHTALLLQAVKTDDTDIIYELMSTLSEESVSDSLRALPSQSVLSLLLKLAESFEKFPGNLETKAILWVRTLLISHASFLMAQTSLPAAINKLYQIVDSRVTVYKKMSKLMGRLDLVLHQASLSENMATSQLSAATIYNEMDEDDDEDEIDVITHSAITNEDMDDSDMEDDSFSTAQ